MLVMSGGNLGVDDPSAIIVTRGIAALAIEPSIGDEACSAVSNLSLSKKSHRLGVLQPATTPASNGMSVRRGVAQTDSIVLVV